MQEMPVEEKIEQAWFFNPHAYLNGKVAQNTQILAMWDHVAAKVTFKVNDLNVVAQGRPGQTKIVVEKVEAGQMPLPQQQEQSRAPAVASAPAITAAETSGSDANRVWQE